MLASRGHRVVVAFLTDGAGCRRGEERARYAEERRAQAREALSRLGAAEAVFLGYPDCRLAEHVAEAAEDVVDLAAEIGARVLYAPHDKEYSPDHRAANAVARLAAWRLFYCRYGLEVEALYEYEVWPPMEGFTDAVDVTDFVEAKRSALEVYARGGQVGDVEAVLGLNRYRAYYIWYPKSPRYAEVFRRVGGAQLRLSPIPGYA